MFERSKQALAYIINILITVLNVDYLIDINNIITGSNNTTLRMVNNKPFGYDKMYMEKYLTEDKLYLLIDQFNENNINHKCFYYVLLENIHPFYDVNRRARKILFVNNFN